MQSWNLCDSLEHLRRAGTCMEDWNLYGGLELVWRAGNGMTFHSGHQAINGNQKIEEEREEAQLNLHGYIKLKHALTKLAFRDDNERFGIGTSISMLWKDKLKAS